MKDMLQALKGKMQPVQGHEKAAKMEVLKELMRMANSIMADEKHTAPPMPVEADQQVTVAAEDPKALEQGLGMAKEMISDDMNPDMEPEIEDEDEEDTMF